MTPQSAKYPVDLHTHSLASGHAYNTIMEMAQEAARRGVTHLGITEHGPSIPGTCNPLYFRNLHVVPRELFGVHLLLGAELNIMNTHGELDLDEGYDRFLSHIIAGIHRQCYVGGTRSQNTDAVLAAMHNKRVNIISHPGDGAAELDFEPIVQASRETRTLIEINNASLKPARHLDNASANNLTLLRLCRKHDVPVILGSDAHFITDIGNYNHLYPLLSDTQFPQELIINHDISLFSQFTGLALNC